MKILLEDFNAEVGRENIFKPTIGNDSLHQNSNDDGVRIVNFVTLKNLVVKSTTYPHRDIRKYNWTSPDGKAHNQIEHTLINRRLYSSILEVRAFSGADCVTDHCMVVAKVRERLAVSKEKTEKFDGERFNLRKLNELEVRKHYQTRNKNKFAALENLSDREDINMVWENIQENIKTSAKESLGLHKLKQHKPWFHEKCLGSLDKRKQAKTQWVQNQSKSSVDNLNNVRHGASKHFRNKKKVYLQAKIEELETTERFKKIGTCVGASMTSKRVSNLA